MSGAGSSREIGPDELACWGLGHGTSQIHHAVDAGVGGGAGVEASRAAMPVIFKLELMPRCGGGRERDTGQRRILPRIGAADVNLPGRKDFHEAGAAAKG